MLPAAWDSQPQVCVLTAWSTNMHWAILLQNSFCDITVYSQTGREYKRIREYKKAVDVSILKLHFTIFVQKVLIEKWKFTLFCQNKRQQKPLINFGCSGCSH